VAAWATFLVLGCGPDNPPPPPCSGADFQVLIAALAGDLPRDLVIRVKYGANPEGEEFRMTEATTPVAVFCSRAKRDGTVLPGRWPIPEGASGMPAAFSGAGGEGGGGGATDVPVVHPPPKSDVEALSCRLWTDGPATLELEAEHHHPIEEIPDLETESGVCTVEEEVLLVEQPHEP
jgi:hypothetical protein